MLRIEPVTDVKGRPQGGIFRVFSGRKVVGELFHSYVLEQTTDRPWRCYFKMEGSTRFFACPVHAVAYLDRRWDAWVHDANLRKVERI